MNQLELVKLESGRWRLLQFVEAGGPIGVTEIMLSEALQLAWPDCDQAWTRTQLDYLEDKAFLYVERHEIKPWRAKLTAGGRDVVTYVTACPAGINRPPARSHLER